MTNTFTSSWTLKPCDICSSTKVTEWGHRTYAWPTRAGIFELDLVDGVCDICSYTYVKSIPTDQFLTHYYQSAFYNQESMQIDFDAPARLRDIESVASPSARILEVGSGNGKFLRYLNARGYKHTTGNDLLEAEEDILSSQPTGKHDLIISYFLLEHILHPRKWLKQLKDFAHEKTFFIFEIPDFETYPQHALNHEHFLYPTRRHIEALLAVNGFKLDRFTTNKSREFGLPFIFHIDEQVTKPSITNADREIVRKTMERYQELRQAREQVFHKQVEAALAQPAKHIYLWGANELALDLMLKFAGTPHKKTILVVDSSPQKIGTSLFNTHYEIIAPESVRYDDAFFIISAVSAYETIKISLIENGSLPDAIAGKLEIF